MPPPDLDDDDDLVGSGCAEDADSSSQGGVSEPAAPPSAAAAETQGAPGANAKAATRARWGWLKPGEPDRNTAQTGEGAVRSLHATAEKRLAWRKDS